VIVRSPAGYHYANQTELQIPARFADVVAAIEGLNDLPAEHPVGNAIPVGRRFMTN
jgi:hypothetical protein